MDHNKAYEILANMEYNQIIFSVVSLLKDDSNAEDLILITYLIRYDLDFVGYCKDATEFEAMVLATAKMNGGEYAGMYGGISWVTFGDLWDTLMKVATDNISILG